MDNKDFGNRYNSVYEAGMQKSIWPWSSVVTILHKLKNSLNSKSKILEIGCGMGANIGFIQSLDYEFYGIDFSNFAVNSIIERYPELSGSVVTGDFTKKLPFPKIKFDLILDRASLTCNPTSIIKDCIQLIKKGLIPSGYFVGVDWYSTEHSGFKEGRAQEDEFSLNFDEKDPSFDPPRMHFSNKEHIIDLFRDFEIIHLEHNLLETFASKFSRPNRIASWNFIAKLN